MDNVEIKEEAPKKKVAKKVVKKVKKDADKVKFMEHMNKKREAAGIKSPAYSKEAIEAYK